MTAAVRVKNGRLARTRKPHRHPAATPPGPPPAPHGEPAALDAAALYALHRKTFSERLAVALIEGCARIGLALVPAPKVRALKKQHARGTDKLLAAAEGRDFVARQAARLHSPIVRAELRQLAQEARRDLDEGRTPTLDAILGQLSDAIDVADRLSAEYSLPCDTCEDWALVYGAWMTRHAQANARASTLKPDVRTISVKEAAPAAKDGSSKSTTVSSGSPWKETITVASTAAARAEYAVEMALRLKGRFHEAERERERQRQSRVWAMKAEAARTAAALPADTRGSDDDEDDEERTVDVRVSEPEEEGEAREDQPTMAARRRPSSRDGEPALTVLPAPIEEPAYCTLRKKQVPASLANVEPPGPVLGDGWHALRREEDERIARWEFARKAELDRAARERWMKENGRA